MQALAVIEGDVNIPKEGASLVKGFKRWPVSPSLAAWQGYPRTASSVIDLRGEARLVRRI